MHRSFVDTIFIGGLFGITIIYVIDECATTLYIKEERKVVEVVKISLNKKGSITHCDRAFSV